MRAGGRLGQARARVAVALVHDVAPAELEQRVVPHEHVVAGVLERLALGRARPLQVARAPGNVDLMCPYSASSSTTSNHSGVQSSGSPL